jgi:lipopolysaccharide O-acetyltransferase
MNNRLNQLKSYSFWRLIRMAFSFLRTRLFYMPALFIFFPLDVRGKRFIQFGEQMTCGTGCRFEAYPMDTGKKTLIFGKNIQVNDYVHITAVNSVSIGDNVLMASRIYISDVQHGDYSNEDCLKQSIPESIAKDRPLSYSSVRIEDNVWIGEGACIMPGVTIGRCSIIGANAVVTKNVPEYCIAAGNPARVIKIYNEQKRCWERCEH